MATQKRLGVRLGIEGEEKVRAALQALGRDGQKALRSLEEAATPASQGLIDIDNAANLAKNAIGGLVAGFSLGAIAGFVRETIEAGKELDILSRKTGESVQTLSEYQFVAKATGATLDNLADTFKDMQERISEAASEGTGEGKEALDELGLSAQKLLQLKPAEAFEQIADAIAALGNEADQNRLAVKLFADNGYELLPAMQLGSAGIKALRQEARDLGVTLDKDAVDKLKKTAAETTRFEAATLGLKREFSLLLVGPLADFTSWLTRNRDPLREFVNDMSRFVVFLKDQAVLGSRALESGSFRADVENLKRLDTQIRETSASLDELIRQRDSGNFIGPMRDLDQKILETQERLEGFRQQYQDIKDSFKSDEPLTIEINKPAGTEPPPPPPDKPPGPSLQAIEAARDLQKEYEKLKLSLQEQIALFGQTGQAAQLRYEIENLHVKTTTGGIVKLDEARKKDLRGLADQIEHLEKAAKAQEKWVENTQEARRLYEQVRTPAEQYADTVDHLNRMLEQGFISQETYNRHLEKAQEALTGMKTTAAAMEEVWKNATQRIDDAFADLWRGVLDGTLDAMDALKRFFMDTLAELAHAALTRPIVLQISAALGGAGAAGTAAAGPVGQGVGGSLLQSGIGSLLSAGAGGIITGIGTGLVGAGATTFGSGVLATGGLISQGGLLSGGLSALGNAGSLLAGGNIAAGIGAALPILAPLLIGGALLSGLFKQKPSDKAQGLELDFATGDVTQTGDLSGKKFSQENRDAVDSFGQSVQSLVASLESVTGRQFTESIGLAVGSRDGLRGRIGAQSIQGSDPEAFLDQFFDALIDRFDGLGESFKNLLKATEPERVNEMAAALASVNGFLDADLHTEYGKLVSAANMTLYESFQSQASAVERLARNYDGTVDATLELANATQLFGQTALAVLQQIDAARASVGQNAESFLRAIDLSVLDTEGQYGYLKEEADSIAEELARATDPARIAELQQSWFQAATAAFNLLDDDQRKTLAPEFRQDVRDIDTLTNERLDAVESRVGRDFGEQQTLTQQQIDAAGKMVSAADRIEAATAGQQAAANTNVAAANTAFQASDRFLAAANTPLTLVDQYGQPIGRRGTF